MARNVDVHPSDAIIQAYGHGRLAPAEAAKFEKHLAGCAVCGEKLGRVATDTFSDLLRGGAGDTGSARPEGIDFPEIPPELRTHSRYAIQRKLGSGGMGVVYQAMHRVMRRPVALKTIRPDLVATPLAVSRFRREVEAAARLTHPNIVTAFDAENAGGVHFLVMEFVDGVNLEHLVEEKGPFPAAQACELALQVAKGLQHAHSFGMVHRDVKPGNLMLTNSGTVKILDFGLAAWSTHDAPSVTHFGARVGTAAYAAPEQYPSLDRVDARADQYGLGATLYFLLTGRPPGKKLGYSPDVPMPVRAIVERLLAVNPDERYPSTDDVVKALEACCAPTEDTKRQASKQPSRPLMTRRRLIVAAVGLVAILVGLSAWLAANRVSSRRDDVPPKAAGRQDAVAKSESPALFLLPSRGLWYEDYYPARQALEQAGHKVLVATPGGVPSSLHSASMSGKPNRPESVPADLNLRDVKPGQFDAVFCVGYDHTEFTNGQTPTSLDTMRLLRQAHDAGKWVVGICTGQYVVGSADLLRGKNTARPTKYVSDPASMGALPQEQSVVVDGRIITASSPQDAAAAATALLRGMKNAN